MEKNPWAVANLEDFLYFCCPECNDKSQSEETFLDHAFQNHPKSKDCLINFVVKYEPNVDDYSNVSHELSVKQEDDQASYEELNYTIDPGPLEQDECKEEEAFDECEITEPVKKKKKMCC